MLARILRRPLVAGAAQAQRMRTGLADFFEAGRDPNQDSNITYGRSWKAEELRQKAWEVLHQLWYVCLKEKNMLLSQKQMLLSQNMRMPNPERFPKVLLLALSILVLSRNYISCTEDDVLKRILGGSDEQAMHAPRRLLCRFHWEKPLIVAVLMFISIAAIWLLSSMDTRLYVYLFSNPKYPVATPLQ